MAKQAGRRCVPCLAVNPLLMSQHQNPKHPAQVRAALPPQGVTVN